MTNQEFAEKYKGCKAIWKHLDDEIEGTIIGYYGYSDRIKFVRDGYPYAQDGYHTPNMDTLTPIISKPDNTPLPLPG